MHFYTYKITNLTNGKFYIGAHKTTNLEDGYMGSGKILKCSIAKHGLENFHKEILMFHESESEMFEIEALIVDQEFVGRKDTYNIKLGGFGGWDYVNSNLSIDKRRASGKLGAKRFIEKLKDPEFMSRFKEICSENSKKAWAAGKCNNDHLREYWLGNTHTDETKAKMSASNTHQRGESNSQFGKIWIYSLSERKSTRINKDDPIPEGWIKGRKMFK